MNLLIMAVVRPTCFLLYEKVWLQTVPKSVLWLHCNLSEKKKKKEKEKTGTGLDCFGHCRCLFSCHSLQPVSSLFSDSLLFCLTVPDSLPVCTPHPSSSSPFPTLLLLPALPEHGWLLGLASLSLCHVCNLNCGRAKQGWATRKKKKAFHKTRLSLKSLWTMFSEE